MKLKEERILGDSQSIKSNKHLCTLFGDEIILESSFCCKNELTWNALLGLDRRSSDSWVVPNVLVNKLLMAWTGVPWEIIEGKSGEYTTRIGWMKCLTVTSKLLGLILYRALVASHNFLLEECFIAFWWEELTQETRYKRFALFAESKRTRRGKEGTSSVSVWVLCSALILFFFK